MLYSIKLNCDKGALIMKLEEIDLPIQNKVMQSYNDDEDFINTYFDYKNTQSSFPKRLEELTNRSFNRNGVAQTIRSFMEPFGISERANIHIDELESNAVTVIGGQQAGILTGPLFSVHKAITVILLAKKQRELLKVPVVPIFWIAGEDHDLNEINHVYTQNGNEMVKDQIKDKFALKLMASDAHYDKEDMKQFVCSVFSKFGETAYTKPLLEDVLTAVETETTFTNFFVRLMNGLFANEGLLFIDSAYKPLRRLESVYFQSLIENAEGIAASVFKQEDLFDKEGYGKPLDAKLDAAHLFYVHTTGRVLLSRKGDYFINDSAGLRFTKKEMFEIVKQEPWRFSNNVATRPMMQDLVFPVLSFVGGPGEIAYWALLKDAFHRLNIKMPIIVPRMSMTLISRSVSKVLCEKSFDFTDVLSGKVSMAREEFIEENEDEEFELAIEEAQRVLIDQYKLIASKVEESESMMHETIQKNLVFHQSQFDYLKMKSKEALFLKHEVALRKFDLLENGLYPNDVLQERIYTPYKFLNEYGPTLIDELLKLPLHFENTHKVIHL